MTEQHTIIFQPSGRRGQVPHGMNVRAAARSLGVEIESICAENSTCGKCKVLVQEGEFQRYGITSSREHLSAAGREESTYFGQRAGLLAARGWEPGQVRLACQARVLGDVLIDIPEESRGNKQIVRKAAIERNIEIKPSLRKYLVELTPPTLSNPKADWERLASGVATSMGLVRAGEPNLPRPAELTIDFACLKALSQTLRDGDWRVTVTVWQDREVVRVEAGYADQLYGAAVDIGTTTIALYLCNLENGEIVAAESEMNPQIVYGEDVMSRIQYTIVHEDGLRTLHKTLIRSLNQMLARAARDAGIAARDIQEFVVAGNTTMHHIFLNIPPKALGHAPFASAVYRALDIKARELGLLINESANVHVLPNIAAFIGADTTAVLLAEEPHEQEENWLIMDVGTNAEVVLGNKHRLICASTPTGPALEGAHIEYGMRAAPGAIERVRIDAQTLEPRYKLIGEDEWNTGKPKGICGSAVLDTVAEMYRVGLLDARGKMLPTEQAPLRVRRGKGGMEYVIAFADETFIGADIVVTQKDVRQIQLAKGALYVAARTLLDQFKLDAPDKILLAGAFGMYIDKNNALSIGMLPKCPPENIFAVGNSAGDGARIALLNIDKRREAYAVASRVTRHELPTDPAFQDLFIRSLNFPERVNGIGAKP
ncbi:MAG TPA: ASKHA domain-containing protein [Anaerolineales bacterium]|nr:ASKHA domain-containing protein [Anaerolineales bacterium]